MIAEDIRDFQRAAPFEPYTVVTSDGAELYARHPDYVFLTPDHTTVFIYSTETERQIVSVSNITRIVPSVKKMGPKSLKEKE